MVTLMGHAHDSQESYLQVKFLSSSAMLLGLGLTAFILRRRKQNYSLSRLN